MGISTSAIDYRIRTALPETPLFELEISPPQGGKAIERDVDQTIADALEATLTLEEAARELKVSVIYIRACIRKAKRGSPLAGLKHLL